MAFRMGLGTARPERSRVRQTRASAEAAFDSMGNSRAALVSGPRSPGSPWPGPPFVSPPRAGLQRRFARPRDVILGSLGNRGGHFRPPGHRADENVLSVWTKRLTGSETMVDTRTAQAQPLGEWPFGRTGRAVRPT